MSSASARHFPTTRLSQPGEPPWDVALLYPLQGSWTEPDYQRVTVLVLEDATYRQHGLLGLGDTATSVLLPGLAVSVTELFASDPQERR